MNEFEEQCTWCHHNSDNGHGPGPTVTDEYPECGNRDVDEELERDYTLGRKKCPHFLDIGEVYTKEAEEWIKHKYPPCCFCNRRIEKYSGPELEIGCIINMSDEELDKIFETHECPYFVEEGSESNE